MKNTGVSSAIRPGGIGIVGAPSSLGIRPYENGGGPRRLDRAPGTLRAQGLVAALGAEDFGNVQPPPYRDFVRTPGAVRNERAVARFSRSLATRVEAALGHGRFAVVLGGDCSIVLGCLLGARRQVGRIGLIYVDAHADFATPRSSATGSAASMCLALAVGQGQSLLAYLDGDETLVREEHVVLLGRRDVGLFPAQDEALRRSAILDMRDMAIQDRGPAASGAAAREHPERAGVDGFWIHVDADVLDPGVMPAVDSPEPGGLRFADLAALLGPLATHPRAVGLQLTIYDPQLDPGLDGGRRLTQLLQHVLRTEPSA